VRLHGDFQEGRLSKIFDNQDFGYRQIAVERPLRVRYRATDDGLERFLAAKPILALTAGDDEMRETLSEAFRAAGLAETTERKAAEKSVAAALAGMDGLGPKIVKEMLKALTVRDETAPVVMGKSGPEPDPDLRDTEDVPLKEDVHAYFDREVRPYLADGWIDESRTKIGYEIPFTRHFYEYVPPRPLEQIDAEIKQLETEIQDLLRTAT
jgi:type I restriction enzyme M protein